MTGGVAADAIGKIIYALFLVFCSNLVRVVLVAAVAGVGLQVARVAGLAGAIASLAMVQREAVRLVELGRRPGGSSVAGGAVSGEQPGVEGRIAVTGDALLGCALEDIVHMALRAFYAGMRPGQLEGSLGVVETGIFPVVRCVAAAAICAKLALMSVILGMAGRTILWCSFEDAIDVAFIASYIGMRAGQLKSRFGVVKGGFIPILGRMASGAIHAELTLVGVILGMAVAASLPGRLEIRQSAHAVMAGRTIDRRMLAGQLERKLAVVETASKTVYPVVAGPAFCSVGLNVGLHKCGVDLSVASLAHDWVEAGETGAVAVFAGEIRPISHPLVSRQ